MMKELGVFWRFFSYLFEVHLQLGIHLFEIFRLSMVFHLQVEIHLFEIFRLSMVFHLRWDGLI